MGAVGTDVAIETADIALMTDDLEKIPTVIRLSRKALRVIKENLVFAIVLIPFWLSSQPGWVTMILALSCIRRVPSLSSSIQCVCLKEVFNHFLYWLMFVSAIG